MRNILKVNKLVWILSIIAVFTLIGCSKPQSFTLTDSIYSHGVNTNRSVNTYDAGQSVTITAPSITGLQFDHWSGDASGTSTTTTIIMNGNKTVTCNYTLLPQSLQPTNLSFNIGTGSGNYSFPSINLNDRIKFNFTVAGSDVTYSVQDPNGNIILIGNGGNKVSSGEGSFTASAAGSYKLHFVSSGVVTPSVLTINGTIYFAQ